VDGARFINSDKASLHDKANNFSPNRNSFIDDVKGLTEEKNSLKQEYEEHIDNQKKKNS
jgi:hypothetical protein